jgi:protein-disulfide isomerase
MLPLPLAARPDTRETERALGSATAPHQVIEWFSFTCPHCADFGQETFPALKARWIVPGQLHWAFADFPTDRLALQAAAVARYLPPDRYERFVATLFAAQAHWAFQSPKPADDLWLLAHDAGMARTDFDRAIADTELANWILSRAGDAQSRWNIDGTPSFLVDGKLYVGAMSFDQFSAILTS